MSATLISYVNNTTDYTRGIPIHLQRLMMAQYAGEQSLEVRFEQLEIEVMTHLPTLLNLLEVEKPDAVLLFSIYALPDDPSERSPVWRAALASQVTLCFANEAEVVRTAADRDRIERILGFGRLASATV